MGIKENLGTSPTTLRQKTHLCLFHEDCLPMPQYWIHLHDLKMMDQELSSLIATLWAWFHSLCFSKPWGHCTNCFSLLLCFLLCLWFSPLLPLFSIYMIYEVLKLCWCFFPLLSNCRFNSTKMFGIGNELFIVSVKSMSNSKVSFPPNYLQLNFKVEWRGLQ